MLSASKCSSRPDSGLPLPEQHLDRLGRLQRADHAAQHAEHARLLARRRHVGRRRLRVEAAVAGAFERQERRHRPLEAVDAAVDHRLAQLQRRVVDQVARREVVRAVDDDVVVLDDVEHVLGRQPRLVPDHLHVRVQLGDRRPSPTRPSACRPDRSRAGSAAAGSTRRPRRRRRTRPCRRRPPPGTGPAGEPEPARAEAQHLRLQQLRLAQLAHLGQHGVPRVAQALLRRHHERPVELQPGALPGREPARHRLDVGVAELGQRLGAPAPTASRPRSKGRSPPIAPGPDPRCAARGSRARSSAPPG